MKKTWIAVFILMPVFASVQASSDVPKKVPSPYFLQAKDKVPRKDLACPDVDLQGSDGKPLDLEVNIQPPDSKTLDLLSDPSLFEEIQRQKPSETVPQRFYWHSVAEVDYCHFKDLEGNHWYGWKDEEGKFDWVLWRGHRYWWRDSIAGHWLYYFHGVWWRADGQTKNSLQADLAGEYYACDAQGNILEDRGGDGEGGIVSAPGHYQGDAKAGGGGHGNHGGHGSHSGASPQGNNGGQSSPSGGSSSAPNNSPSNPSAGN